jgi:DinB superfamily/Pentapeptide repeats (8 copies)
VAAAAERFSSTAADHDRLAMRTRSVHKWSGVVRKASLAEAARQGEVMATFTRSDDLQGAEFVGADLRGARFVGADLSGVVMRGVEVSGADVDAELDRRFPGRADRRAGDPGGLRTAWATVQRTWAATLERAAAMPAGTVDVSVAGEWSFAQTLRHLVLATDMWLGRAILEIEHPFHPIGQLDAGTAKDDAAIFMTVAPSYDEVLEVRAGRVAMVRDFLATVTSEELAATRRNPHATEHPETVLSCLHTILEEEWEHHRYAVRDLDAIEAKSEAS